ncbi:MAG TPA: hypothetical protein VNT57_06630 [Desulfobacteria bacterium]|nr:hypothetical protein [Desulfobacteria bacterium]
MFLYRLRWFLLLQSKRAGLGRNRPNKLPLLSMMVMAVLIGGAMLLASIWKVFMNGFLVSTPWVPGASAGTYYLNSIEFALKSTFIVGIVMLLAIFILGAQLNRVFRK